MNEIAQDINLKLPIKELIHTGCEIDFYGARYILSRYCGVNLLRPPLKKISDVAWIHGWVPEFWNNTSPKMLTGYIMTYKSQLFLTIRQDNESYLNLKSCGYTNTYAVGLPVVYLEKRKIERVRDSLLVMPSHSLDYTTHSHWKFEQYAQEIEKIAKYFKYVYVCVHPSCIKKGYWICEFQKRGFKIIEGISVNDKNALYRLQTLLSTFEYVTTNAFGSHIAYATYFGAKVSIYGSYCEYREEDFKDDPFYLANPEVLNIALNLLHERTVRQHLKDFFVLPQEATVRKDWGEYQVGLQHKKKPLEMLRILFYGKTKSFSSWFIHDLKEKLKKS